MSGGWGAGREAGSPEHNSWGCLRCQHVWGLCTSTPCFLSSTHSSVGVVLGGSLAYHVLHSGPCPCWCVTLQVGCKLSLVLFQDCIMSSFYWLLAEGLHLHALLVAMLPGRCFTAYLLIGWGKLPSALPPLTCPLPADLGGTFQLREPLLPL